VARLSDWIDGFGPLSVAMTDPDVTDVLVNGPDEVWVERAGCLERTSIRFEDGGQLMDLIERLLGAAGGRADAAHPIADVRLGDGSRAHVVLPPLSGLHPVLSIRRFPVDAFSLTDLEERGFMTGPQRELLEGAVSERRTVVIGGGTGTGKTTLANALLGCIRSDERVVVIEETPELRPVCPHWVSLVARPPNIEGQGAVDQADLLRAALRMRPDRIVVGEVRGPEALIALQAMATGHEGSMVTVHARSAADVPERLVDLASMSERSPAEEGLRRRVHASIDLVVQVARVKGLRRVVEIVQP
jgi:pilus assembly protein CpaF